MKKIYFIRHAKSSWKEEGLSDFERPLNKRGKRDVPFMGERLKQFSILPDLILSSPALRAKKTAKCIAKTIGYPKERIVYDMSLYESSYNQYLSLIHSIEDSNEEVFIIAHNPDITEVSEILSDALIGNMPTGSILCIEFPVDHFEDIDEGTGRVLFFDYPKKHLKDETT